MAVRIGFLDDDHVTRVARLALSDPGPEEQAWLHDLFAPERFDPVLLDAEAAGLRRRDGAEVMLAAGAQDEGVAGLDIAVFRRARVDQAFLDRNPRLRLVQRLGEASDGIDLQAATERGVHVSCLPRRTLTYTAEHAILLMLALRKRLLTADTALRHGDFDPASVRAIDDVAYNWIGLGGITGLSGASLGIVGLGEVGRLVARLAMAFGMTLLYSGRRRLAPAREAELRARYLPLHDLLAEADIVSLHAPDTPSTRGLIGAAELAVMRPTAFLVNTSRGRLVDEDALYAALQQGRIAGAGLDVHQVEPRPADDRFCGLANVVMTPHLAGGSRLGVIDEIRLVFRNCRDVLAGGAPTHGVVRP